MERLSPKHHLGLLVLCRVVLLGGVRARSNSNGSTNSSLLMIITANIYRPPSYLYDFLFLKHFGVLRKIVLENTSSVVAGKEYPTHTHRELLGFVYEFHVGITKSHLVEAENLTFENRVLKINSQLLTGLCVFIK